MKILIVDDEALARDRLSSLIQDIGPPYETIETAANGRDAVEKARHLNPELVLMDIRMPGMDGLEAAGLIAAFPTPPAIIFTTAYGEFSLEAFERDARDYLLKPISKDRLIKALEKAAKLNLAQMSTLEQTQHQPQFIQVTSIGSIRRIPVDQIIYMMADTKYVTVTHAQGQDLTEDSLVSIEQRFPGRFIRIHRNALIAAQSFMGLSKDHAGNTTALLQGCDEQIRVSRRHLPELRKLLKQD